MDSRKQAGFGIIEMLLGVVVLGVLALIGYQVYQSNQNLAVAPTSTEFSNTQPSSVHDAIKNVPPIKTVDDLDKASQSLDSTQVDDSATNDIDNEMNFQ